MDKNIGWLAPPGPFLTDAIGPPMSPRLSAGPLRASSSDSGSSRGADRSLSIVNLPPPTV
ncbi:hypothetical protein [Actinomyces naeslundii]|uniref:hypothetical protein n=1 Tax=Actinomyces naeslundii TaxID=1655 RepID=UPI000B1F8A6D|nr:hypothetical protein [Actinomyces naeslundii]